MYILRVQPEVHQPREKCCNLIGLHLHNYQECIRPGTIKQPISQQYSSTVVVSTVSTVYRPASSTDRLNQLNRPSQPTQLYRLKPVSNQPLPSSSQPKKISHHEKSAVEHLMSSQTRLAANIVVRS